MVSEQFTLWDQEGSEVLRGKMIIEPTNGLILYIQPVYLQQEGQLRIPQLKRVIMAHDDAVVMSTSLEEAAAELEEKLRDKFGRQKRRFPTRSTAALGATIVSMSVTRSSSSRTAPCLISRRAWLLLGAMSAA